MSFDKKIERQQVMQIFRVNGSRNFQEHLSDSWEVGSTREMLSDLGELLDLLSSF